MAKRLPSGKNHHNKPKRSNEGLKDIKTQRNMPLLNKIRDQPSLYDTPLLQKSQYYTVLHGDFP